MSYLDWTKVGWDVFRAAAREIAEAQQGEVTLDLLYQWLQQLDGRAQQGLSLNGIAYEMSTNESLGLSGKKDDFVVSIPWDNWKAPENASKEYPTPLQAAMLNVISEGIPSVRDAIVDFVENCPPASRPVVRFLVGDDAAKTRTEAWSTTDKDLFTRLFWDNGHPRIKHPNARIYVGYYNPDFNPKSDANAQKFVESFTDTIANLMPVAKPYVEQYKSLIQAGTDSFIQTGVRTVTWNHGKVLAVNGKVLLTGGGNYWDVYRATDLLNVGGSSKRIDHNIVDHQVQTVGDAAVSAHQWCNYFWQYLNNPAATDHTSIAWGAKFSDTNPIWFSRFQDLTEDSNPPFEHARPEPRVLLKSKDLPQEAKTCPAARTSKGKTRVLTVAKLGDWYGTMQQIQYPIMIVDMLRDFALNVYWQQHVEDDDTKTPSLGERMWRWNKVVGDEVLSGANIFNKFGVNPVAWASRYTRNEAIAHATTSVIICQQMLVQGLAATSKTENSYQNLIASINDKLQLTASTNADLKIEGKKWDGFVWPFDLMIAIAQAIGRIYKNSSAQNAWKGVFIVLTTKKPGVRVDWDDRTSIELIRRRITRIMLGLSTYAAGLSDKIKVNDAVNKYLRFRRVGKDNGEMYSHSKLVCVDERLMYVGSDNAYPCYNEEHGIWVEDKEAVGLWLDKFFDPYWKNNTTVPQDEDQLLPPRH